MLILGFTDYEVQGRAFADAAGASFCCVEIHRFPDGESQVRVPAPVPAHVVLCRTLDHPNDKLVELLLAARTARHLGAQRLTLVAPYLCYMRQDAEFERGDAVSQKIIGQFLGELFDDVVTVDPHLHRTESLAEALPNTRSMQVTATGLMAEHLLAFRRGPTLLVGPDQESKQWVEVVAKQCELPFAVATKTRFGDREVIVDATDLVVADRHVVLIDDVCSSGETLATAARALRARGASGITAMVSHAVFSTGAVDVLRSAGIGEIVSSDSVCHPSNGMALAQVLANGLARVL